MTLYQMPWVGSVTRTNRCRNPAFTVSSAEWSPFVSAGGGAVTITRGSPGGLGFPYRGAVNGVEAGTTLGAFTSFTATGGLPYLISAVVAASFGDTTLWYVQWFDVSTLLRTDNGSVMYPRDKYERIHLPPLTAPAGATRAVLHIRRSGPFNAGSRVYITGVLIDEGQTKLLDYFDGDTLTPAGEGTWLGTVGLSASTLTTPNAQYQLDTLATLMPYTATRRSRTVVHTLLDEPVQLFTFRQATLPEGVFEVLIESHTAAYAALNKLSARTAWALYDEADDGPIERWFMVAGGDIEMRQSDEVAEAYVLRVPYVEVDSL